ncbi:MAG: hypothetical protein M1834_006721 [Cirrosporium novae-zelandiae]|nr:MAG: hypothetical protein M1834_006721 [Cirrosporium novae-zelandiae]
MALTSLPPEILIHILHKCSPHDIPQVSSTSWFLNTLITIHEKDICKEIANKHGFNFEEPGLAHLRPMCRLQELWINHKRCETIQRFIDMDALIARDQSPIMRFKKPEESAEAAILKGLNLLGSYDHARDAEKQGLDPDAIEKYFKPLHCNDFDVLFATVGACADLLANFVCPPASEDQWEYGSPLMMECDMHYYAILDLVVAKGLPWVIDVLVNQTNDAVRELAICMREDSFEPLPDSGVNRLYKARLRKAALAERHIIPSTFDQAIIASRNNTAG